MRPPLRSGITAGSLPWEILPSEAASALRPLNEWLPGRFEVVPTASGVPRYLRSFAEGAEPAWFVKIVGDDELPAARLEADLGRAIATEGVVTPLFAAELALNEGVSAIIFHWTRGIHPTSGKLDFFALGTSLNRLHRAFANVADRFSIGARTTQRLNDIEQLALSEMFNQRWEGCEHECFAFEMRDAFLANLEKMKWGTGAIHGDLNPGNIMLQEETFAFLDFEDTLHSQLWPGLDVAKIIERLILPSVDEKGRNASAADFLALLRGYGLDSWPADSPSIREALRWHIGLSVLVITKVFPKDTIVANTEIDKFRLLDNLMKLHEKCFV